MNNKSSTKNAVLFNLIEEHSGANFERILVVGCGKGQEALDVASRFGCEVVGVDLGGGYQGKPFEFVRHSDPRVDLRIMSVCDLDFPDGHFDLLYSFHALEHIHPLGDALSEMRRVLRPGGSYCIGTPNKTRLLGYVGAEAPLKKKILWNWADFKKRLRGEWSNEQGAHAGFTREELRSMCGQAFGAPQDITDAYYRGLYGRRHPKLIKATLATPLKHMAVPCVYVVGRAGLQLSEAAC